MGKDGSAAARTAYFKSVNYPLKPGLTRFNGQYVDSIWIYTAPNQPAQQPGNNWTFVAGKDIPGQGDVHQIPEWRSKASLEDLKLYCAARGWSGFCLGKDGTGAAKRCYFKKVNYALAPEHPKPSVHVDGIWILSAPGPTDVAQPDGPNWTKVPGYDIAGEGDVKLIKNWPATHTLDQLKQIVIDNSWNAVVIGKAHTGAANNAYFKRTAYHLKPQHTKLNAVVDAIYISNNHVAL